MFRVFVYGTLKRGGCRSHALVAQRFLAEATTVARYRMYNTGSYPAMVEDGNGIQVEGEVWEVDADCLRALDAMEGVPTLYERRPVALAGPGLDGVEAYFYRQSVAGMPDCGRRWENGESPDAGDAPSGEP